MNNRGFTLIEMLVSVALFTVAMTIALGALLALAEANRRAQGLNSSINNLSFALDSMSRTLRTGLNYHCGSSGTVDTPQNCESTAQPYLATQVFDGSLNGCTVGKACTVIYCLSSGTGNNNTCNGETICPLNGKCTILRSVTDSESLPDTSELLPMTSGEITITALKFYVIGASASDSIQPKISILLSGSVPLDAGQTSAFNMQTSVTQRFYDR